MPQYSFEAAGPDGAIIRGQIEAATQNAAVEQLCAQGRTPLRVQESSENAVSKWHFRTPALTGLNTGGDRLKLLQELGILLRAGLTVERALVAMQGLTNKPRLKSALQSILQGLRGGDSLSNSLARTENLFPAMTRNLVAAGEASGRLPEVVSRLAQAQAKIKELTDRVVSAMIYPMLLLLVMFAVLAMIFTVVLPRLEPLFAESGAALPWPTALLLAISHFLDAYGLWLTLALVVGLVLALYAIRQPHGQPAADASG